jgi:hypothetical protein
MRKHLEYIRKETVKNLDDNSEVMESLDKQYFKYVCHDPEDICKLEPIVCRTVDKFNPFDEPVWEADQAQCSQCIKADSRVLEDIYT